MQTDQIITGLESLAGRTGSTNAADAVEAAQRAAGGRRRRRLALSTTGMAVLALVAALGIALGAEGRGGRGTGVASGSAKTERTAGSTTEVPSTAVTPAPIGSDEVVAVVGPTLSGPNAAGGTVVALSTTGRGSRPIEAPGRTVVSASIDPQGTRMVFEAPEALVEGSPNAGPIFLYDLSDGSTTPVTAIKEGASPEWDPAGERIGVIGGQGISIVDLATDKVQLVPIAGPRQFSWSPDGSQIVVAHGTDPATISIIDVAKGTTRPFAPVAGELTGPSWSPDGSTIVFTEGGTNRLLTAAPDGTAVRPLTTCEDPCTGDDAPSWSPDGRTIAFARNFGGLRQIATVPAAGGEVTLLTTDSELDHSAPDWR